MRTFFSIVFLLGVAGTLFWYSDWNQFRSVVPLIIAPTELSGDNLPFTVPSGFAVSLFSNEVPGVRVLARDPRGTFVASLTGKGTVVALPNSDNDHIADAVIPILENLNKPHGLAFNCPSEPPSPCVLYVAEEDAVTEYRYNPETYSVSMPRTLASLPSDGGHYTRTLLLHPDGKRLLVSVGSSCNACVEKDARRAKVLAIDLEAGAFGAPTDFVSGLRNTVFMTTHPVDGLIWGTDMGRDLLGDDLPPEEVNILQEGNDYGWPYCYGNNISDTSFGADSDACTDSTPPQILMQAHSAPLGLAFIPEEGWPEDYWFDLLIAYHGSWNRSEPTGYKIVRIELETDGTPTGRTHDFMTGFRTDDGAVPARPVDIMIEPGGTVWVTDDRAGAIYRVFRTSLE